MPNTPNHLFEYAVVRFVPSVERQEFVNVGLIMMCKRQRWIRAAIFINAKRVLAFASNISIEQLSHQLDAFCKVADGDPKAGEIATLPVEERFRWLTAVRSACIQTSRPHPGLTDDLQRSFDSIFAEQVL